ncbi:MAG: hypothetical protein ACKO9I_21820 [Sphaerospermopsis kisseleviana]
MIKQKFTLSLGLISILLGSLAASPPRANAGQQTVPGTTAESSTLIGDTAAVIQLLQGGTPTITGISVSPGVGGNVNLQIVAPQIQIQLSNTVVQVISALNAGGNAGGADNAGGAGNAGGAAAVASVLGGNDNAPAAAAQVTNNLTANGVPAQDAQELTDALGGIVENPGSAQVRSEQRVATAKSLKGDSAIAQATETPNINVNINNLNKAIETYNRIIKQSDLPTLQKLSKDETFMAINKVLKQLRAALN